MTYTPQTMNSKTKSIESTTSRDGVNNKQKLQKLLTF